MKRLALAGGLLLLLTGLGQACFGPKLYVGVGGSTEEIVCYELVSLYLKEKTGIETVLVDLDSASPLQALEQQQVDLAFAAQSSGPFPALLQPLPRLVLLAGERPLSDLQFTTVPRALKKLSSLLRAEEVRKLTDEVDAGQPVKARVRRLLMERRWI